MSSWKCQGGDFFRWSESVKILTFWAEGWDPRWRTSNGAPFCAVFAAKFTLKRREEDVSIVCAPWKRRNSVKSLQISHRSSFPAFWRPSWSWREEHNARRGGPLPISTINESFLLIMTLEIRPAILFNGAHIHPRTSTSSSSTMIKSTIKRQRNRTREAVYWMS